MNGKKRNRFVVLLRYASPYKKWVALQFVLMALSIGFGLLKPWPLRVLIDNVADKLPFSVFSWHPVLSTEGMILLACLSFILLNAGDSLTQFASTNVATFSSSSMIRDLRADLLNCLQALSLKFHDQRRVGDLVYRVTYNTSAVETAFQSGFMGTIKSLFSLIGIFIVMYSMNPKLTFVALAIVPLLLICIRAYAKRIQQVSRLHQDQEGMISTRLQEVLSGIRLVQAFNREPWEQSRFNEISTRSVATRQKMTVAQGAFGMSVALTLAFGTALLFYVGIGQVLAGPDHLTKGEFLVFLAYLAMLYAPLSVLSYMTSSVQSALGGGARLFEILEMENDNSDGPQAKPLAESPREIAIENVSFGYSPNQLVLRDIDFKIHPGEILAIVGQTGSGKSTILSLLLRFYKPDSGRIMINGIDICDVTLSSLRDQISLVHQEALLFSDSIRENIAYARPDASDEEIEEAARLAEAHDFITQLPEGYTTKVGERGVRLSVGQRQRVALARAFLRQSPVLLLDEPTSALDAETEARLMANIHSRFKNKFIILVTHRLSTINVSDRIIVLHQGRIVEQGSHDDLLTMNGAYRRLWHTQTQEKAGAVN